MHQRLIMTLVIAIALSGLKPAEAFAAQRLSTAELARVEEWFRRTSERTGDGQWGIAIGAMDGRVLWSLNPHEELIPASTAKVFTVGFL